MTGVHSTTVSPSRRSTRRKTPCVLGCCGPRLSSISWVVKPSAPVICERFAAVVFWFIVIEFSSSSVLLPRGLSGLRSLAQHVELTHTQGKAKRPQQSHCRGY